MGVDAVPVEELPVRVGIGRLLLSREALPTILPVEYRTGAGTVIVGPVGLDGSLSCADGQVVALETAFGPVMVGRARRLPRQPDRPLQLEIVPDTGGDPATAGRT